MKIKPKTDATRKDVYNELVGRNYLIPFNLTDYKVYDMEGSGFEIVMDLLVFSNSPDEAHLLVESKMTSFLAEGDFFGQFDVSSFAVESSTRLNHYTEYTHTKDNIDVDWFVETDKQYLFEVTLEDEVTSVEDYEVDTIRIDIDKETMAFAAYVTYSEDYDVAEEIDTDTQSIDMQEIVPHLFHFRHNYLNVTDEYNESYAERRAKGEAV
ncbi:hypothetical protein ACQR3P_28925 [Rhodococcus sp. IEGM1300]